MSSYISPRAGALPTGSEQAGAGGTSTTGETPARPLPGSGRGVDDARHANRTRSRVAVVDPLGGRGRRHEDVLRDGSHPLRRAAARPHRRSRRLAPGRPVPFRQPAPGVDRRRRRRSDHRRRLLGRVADGRHDVAGRPRGWPGPSRRSACRSCRPSRRSTATRSASCRPPVAGRACRRHGGSPARPSSSGRARWCGAPCRSRSMPTGTSTSRCSLPAPSLATGCTGLAASSPLNPA